MRLRIFGALVFIALPLAASAQSTLIIRSDAACTLTVNATPQGQLQADTAKAVKTGGGEQLIECKAANGARAEQALSIDSGTQKVVNLQLAAKVNAIASGIDKRFTAPGDGTVIDSQTGLQWAQRDSGQDIDWNNSNSYCSNLGTAGGGWRLPSTSELEGIYDVSATLTTTCRDGKKCRVSPLFSLTGFWYWSNQPNGSREALHFGLTDGRWYSGSITIGFGSGALCVRRSS